MNRPISNNVFVFRKSLVSFAGFLLILFVNTHVSLAQVVLPVTEDAYVDSQFGNTNYGSDPLLRLRSLSSPSRWNAVYLKFAMSSLPVGTTPNDIKAATLKLYVSSTFGSGTGITFDGSNIWVPSDSAIFKRRVSDGTLLATLPRVTGANYSNVAFDGANMWVTNSVTNTVTKH